MKRHLTNAVFGVLDYASYPLGMLLAAPLILHKLGAAEYGLWMVATAIVSAGGILASGFCDANIQRVGRLRSTGAASDVLKTVRSMMGINLVLGLVLAIAVWFAAPIAARHIAAPGLVPVGECLLCLRIAAGMILVRAIETVGVSTHRAFEQYRITVQISGIVRLLTLGVAATLALLGLRTVSILLATAFFLVAGTWFQFRGLHSLIGSSRLWPTFSSREAKGLIELGMFAWLQTLGSVIFGQLDRILLGVSMGALAVAPYALCIQFAQPVFGLTASGLHFLFPYLSGRAGTLPLPALKQTLVKAFLANTLLVASGAGLLILSGSRLIRLWAGPSVAQSTKDIFVPIVLGSALMGLSVTGTYAMQAFGRFRTVALVSLGGRAAMVLLMVYLLHHMGLRGLAVARVCYGAIALIVYLPLIRALRNTRKCATPAGVMSASFDMQEGSQP